MHGVLIGRFHVRGERLFLVARHGARISGIAGDETRRAETPGVWLEAPGAERQRAAGHRLLQVGCGESQLERHTIVWFNAVAMILGRDSGSLLVVYHKAARLIAGAAKLQIHAETKYRTRDDRQVSVRRDHLGI